MRTSAQFVTPADFRNFAGIDLRAELPDQGAETDSNKADAFLLRVESRLLSWVDANTWRNVAWDRLGERQREHLQRAILTQALYVFRNGDLTTDSGYDPQRGPVATRQQLAEIEICAAAIDELKTAGLYNHVMDNRKRWPRWG